MNRLKADLLLCSCVIRIIYNAYRFMFMQADLNLFCLLKESGYMWRDFSAIYTLPHDSGWILWYQVGCPYVHPCVRLSQIHPSQVRPSIFLFLADNLSKCQWIFTKLGVCIDIVEIWFGIFNGQILSIFDSYLPATDLYFHLRMITLVNINGFSSNDVCITIMEICFGISDG